ncbi:hypothetical protein ACTXT7_006510, partial [Hymenolepis weldensis]
MAMDELTAINTKHPVTTVKCSIIEPSKVSSSHAIPRIRRLEKLDKVDLIDP